MSEPRKFYPATNDIVFKAIFTRNPDLLKSFIVVALNLDESEIIDIKVLNPDILLKNTEGELSRLDIRLETATDVINIVIQVSHLVDPENQTLFYWSNIYTNELKSGEVYSSSAKKCVCINILNYKMFDTDDFHSEFVVMNKNSGELLTDEVSAHFFELPKIASINKQNQSDDDMLIMWLRLLKSTSDEEMDLLTEANDVIRTGVKTIYELSADDTIKEQIRQREKAVNDYVAAMSRATNEGEKEIAGNIDENEEKRKISEEEPNKSAEKNHAANTEPKIIYELSGDEIIRERIRQREKAINDYIAAMTRAKKEGEARGIAKAEARGKREMVGEIVKKGLLTIEQVAEVAHMTVSEVKELIGLTE